MIAILHSLPFVKTNEFIDSVLNHIFKSMNPKRAVECMRAKLKSYGGGDTQ